LPSSIKQIQISNELIYFFLENDLIFSYNFSTDTLDNIPTVDKMNFIASTSNSLYGFTNQKIYQLLPHSKLIHEFSFHQRIKKVSSGLEHIVILTSNGDLYSFGCGLRGQLGHGDVRSQDNPILIEALAGIKIIDLACGAFHTIVVSSFGDVYSFGWNTNGQLGLKKAPQGSFEKDNGKMKCQQVFTLPQLIELEDESEEIKEVHCGHKHTILKTVSSRLFAAGLNNYGQLGLSSNAKDFDKFTEIPIKISNNDKISCGYFSTYILSE
jgi:alpha-tubulin suppressor-like RCC1 family protein